MVFLDGKEVTGKEINRALHLTIGRWGTWMCRNIKR